MVAQAAGAFADQLADENLACGTAASRAELHAGHQDAGRCPKPRPWHRSEGTAPGAALHVLGATQADHLPKGSAKLELAACFPLVEVQVQSTSSWPSRGPAGDRHMEKKWPSSVMCGRSRLLC